MKKSIFKRALSLLLCIAMLLPMMTALPISFVAAAGSDTDTESSTETTYLDGVHYYIEKSISYIGNRSYQLDVKLHTTLTDTDIVLNRNYARNGYFTVEIDGWYLLELWGGKGADGSDNNSITLVDRPGGKGGAGGYVYAKVYLTKGQTLAYSIGTNGDECLIEGTGGGVNGAGGGHGEIGSQWVGGGGGYSALYFFNQGEFDPAWLTASGYWNLPASVRLSHYVMIAAGGGGGGAANTVAIGNATGANGLKLANGGAGGSINSGVQMTLNGAGGSVAGYLFFGKDGQSSGTSSAYVGKGGTNLPGTSPSASIGGFTATPGPNDWSGAHNLRSTPGAGGSGMFRGGGGGAGFCGGSGGIMTAQSIATNIGGGGGGSSFLAQSIGGNTVYFGNDVDSEKLHGVSGCPSGVGGAFSYTYLGNDGDVEIDTSYLGQVLVQGSFSQYFDIYASPSVNGEANPNGELIYDAESGAFTVTGASIDAASVERDGTLLTLSFYVKAKSVFVGGNNVPLLESLSITMDRGASEPTVIESVGQARTDSVNVPLALSIPTHSKMVSRKDGEDAPTFVIADLYTNEHTEANANTATAGWAYDFVSSVANPVIYTGNQGTSGSKYTAASTPAITETTHYSVTMKVTPKTDVGYAACGPRSEGTETFVGIITITVLDATIFGGEGGFTYDLTANKTLSQKGDYFVFEQSVTQSLSKNYDLTSTAIYSGTSDYSNSSFTISKTGYYLLQVWGSAGGKGADTSARTPVNTAKATGGARGAGAAVYVFAYLEAGDTLHFTLGKAAYTPGPVNNSPALNSTDNVTAAGSGGGGGYPSAIALQKNGTELSDSTYIVIAGGGGGGSGSASAQGYDYKKNTAAKSGYAGESGSATFNYTGSAPAYGTLKDISAFRGTAGASGTASGGYIFGESGLVSATAGSPAGSGGDSYCDAIVANVGATDAETLYLGRLAATLASSSDFGKPTSAYYGAARVSFMCDDETTEELEQFPGVEAGGSFSRYFEIPSDENGIPMIDMNITGVSYDRKETAARDDGSITVTYYEGETLSAQFSFNIKEENSITTYDVFGTVYHPTFRVSKVDPSTYIADCGFSILIMLAPREGFLGGNDVPVLDGLTEGEEKTNVFVKKDEAIGYLDAADKADYANVPISYDVSRYFTVQEGYVVLGDENTDNDYVSIGDLYALSIDLSEYADWQKEFVKIQRPEEDTTRYPNGIDTTFTLTNFTYQSVQLMAGLVPTVPADEAKAVVSGDNEGALLTLLANIYAQYPIIYDLSHINSTGPQYVTYSRPTSIVLTPDTGFLAPDGVTVRNGYGTDLTHTYDAETGLLEIAAIAYLYNPVTVTAAAKSQPYQLHYVFSLDGVNSQEVLEDYDAGAPIDPTFLDTFEDVFGVEAREGHTFTWEWETEDGSRPETMPGHDVWVIGSYHKDLHTLTISYVDGTGTALAPDYTAVLEYGATYSIPSPSVEGYLPDSATKNGEETDPFVISGTVGTEDITVTVTYIGAQGKLIVLYLYPNGAEISRIEKEGLLDGAAFDFLSPAVPGYLPDSATVNGEAYADPTRVSGNVPIGGSLLVQVYYRAEQYRVDLEYRYEGETAYPKPNGSTLSYELGEAVLDLPNDWITVEFGNIIGYNVDTDTYGLPTPVAPGYVFAGWYTDLTFTEQVSEDLTVTLDYPTTLYAKWEPLQYKLTIRFSFVEGRYITPDLGSLPAGTEPGPDDNGDGKPDYYYLSLEYYLEQTYSITLDPMTGYTPYVEYGVPGAESEIGEIAGEMPAFNRLYDVTYEINSYLIRFFAYGGLSNVTFPTHTQFAQEEGPFTEDRQLTEALYEHAEPVVYPEETPNQVREYYTFVPDYYENAAGDKYPVDLTATEDADIFAHYLAHENIATLYQANGTDVISHYYRIGDALDAALAYSTDSGYESESPIVRLHRHEDVAPEDRDLTVDETIVVGAENNGTKTVRLDLAGITLRASDTVFAVRHAALILLNANAESASSIIVESAGDAVAICQDGTAYLTIGSTSSTWPGTVRIEATSTAGNAIGVYATAGGATLNHYSGEIVVDAPAGNAVGILQQMPYPPIESTYYLNAYGNVSATAKGDACAIRTNASAYLYSTVSLRAESENGTAVGLDCDRRLDVGATRGALILAHSVNGEAVGIRSTYRILYDVDYAPGLTVEASSDNKDATAILATAVFSGQMYNVTATAIAPNGTAIAYRITNPTSVVVMNASVTLRAEGREAIAFSATYESRIYATLEAVGTERAIGVYNPIAVTTFGGSANILAESAAGSAYAIYGGTAYAYSYNFSGTGSIVARTETGSAYALYNCSVTGNLLSIGVRAEATGSGSAYGFYVGEGVTCTLYATNEPIVAEAPLGSAFGAYIAGTATLYGSVIATGDTAFGVFVSGSVGEIGSTVTATGTESAFGIAAVGGSITAVQSTLTVTADTTAEGGIAYGLYAANGGKIGAAPVAESLSVGKVTVTATGGGIGYALFAETGNIYITGDSFYYKGSTDDYRKSGSGVVIAAGFVELRMDDADATYPGYYYLKVQGKYTITFVGYDFYGKRLDAYGPFEYIPGVGFTNPSYPTIPDAPTSPHNGYEGAWEEYDFSAPDGVPETPDPNETYDKEVRSVYVPRSFWLNFYFQDNTWDSLSVLVTYGDPIALPAMGTREKTGHVFNGKWQRDDGITDDWTMPDKDLSVSAVWDKDYFTVTVMTGGIEMSFTGDGGEIEILEWSKDKVVIRGQYDTYLDYSYVTPGYTLKDFYLDPAFTQPCGTSRIPAQDITIYARWTESLSVVIMGPFSSYIVNINYWLDVNGNGVREEDECGSLGTLEELFGYDEPLFAPTAENPICMVEDMASIWIMSFLPDEIASMFNGCNRIVSWCAPDGRPIKLAGGLGAWGITPDENGYTNVYARLEAPPEKAGTLVDIWAELLGGNLPYMPVPHDQVYFGQHFNLLYLTQSSAEQDGSDLGGYSYSSYKALTSGEHLFYIAEAGNAGFFTQYEVTLCKQDGTKTVVLSGDEGKLAHQSLDLSFEDDSVFYKLAVEMEAGDTLLIRTHQLPNADGATEDGITLVLLSVPGIHDSLYDMFDPEGDDPLSVLYYYIIAHNATDFFFYAGSMGDVALPLDGSSDSPAFDNVDGWAVSDETMQPTDKVITKVSSDLLGDPSLWLDMDGLALLFLLPHLQEIIEGESWLGAITADRHFAESELPRPSRLPTAITVRGKAALSFLFVAQMETAGEVAALFFTAGLPAGTALTMIDLTEGPTYYFYIITDADVADGSNQQLPLSRFTEMGGGAAFTGCAERMLFQISYPDGEAPASESISIGISTEPAEISLSFTCRKTNEVDLGDREGEDYGYIEETLSIPSLSGRGYGANDQAVLVLRLYDKNGNALPLPANFLVEPTGGTLTTYSSFAYAPLGSVKYFTSAFSLSGKLHLSSLRYLGFEGTAVYEVVVLPAGTDLSEAVVGGTLATVDTRITCALTVNETPGFVLSTDRITASRGETVTLSAELEGHAGEAHEIELYILRREGTQMVYTDACADLLLLPPNGIPVPLDENGRVSVTLTTGTGSFKISENAAPGAYFLVAYYHGRYAVCTIIVTA